MGAWEHGGVGEWAVVILRGSFFVVRFEHEQEQEYEQEYEQEHEAIPCLP